MRHRVDNWQARLRDVIARHRAGPFAFGHLDCGTLWADAVLAVSGVDVLGDLRRRYTTERGALRLFKRLGVPSATGLADSRFERVAAEALHRGDLGFIPAVHSNPLASPCIIDASSAVALGPAGLMAFPRSAVVHGWAV